MPVTVLGYPATSDRSRGWLRYMYRKATTEDNWDKEGQPHPHWDNISNEPPGSWHRMDLWASMYAMVLMADTTPAWREVYGRVLNELAFRHTSYWAAKDWLDQIGHDPRRENYPQGWYENLIPKQLWGQYDVAGWTANGVEPWGLQMDPIGTRRQPLLQGLVPAADGLLHVRYRRPQVAAAIRRRPGRRKHLHLEPTREPPTTSPTSGPSGSRAAIERIPRSGHNDWPERASV